MMEQQYKKTPENVAEAQRLWRTGMKYPAIGKIFGVTGHTIHCWLDPEYARKRRARGKSPSSTEVPRKPIVRIMTERRAPEEDVARRLAEIPADSRSLTAQILGDPLPGRSALDRRNNPTTKGEADGRLSMD